MTHASRSAGPFSKLRFIVLFFIGTATAAFGGTMWLRRWVPPSPPIPADIRDVEVRDAIDAARGLVLGNRYSVDAWGRLGKVFFANLFDQEADGCFEVAAKLSPDDALWPYARGLIASKRRPDEAPALFEQAIKLATESDRPPMQLQLAETLLDAGKVEAAHRLFDDVLSRNPENLRAAYGLGLSEAADGAFDGAMRLLTLAAQSPYCKKKATARLAALAGRKGDRVSAELYEREAAGLAEDRPWPDPILDEVVTLQTGKRGRERRVAELEQQRRFADAAALLLEHWEKEKSIEALIGAGVNLARIQRYDEAFACLGEALKREPANAQGLYALSLITFGRAERAKQEKPDDSRITAWFRQSADYARRAANVRPDNARAWLFLGLSLKHLGEPKAAIEPLRKGLALTPADFELQFGMAEVLSAAGQEAEARRHLGYARQINSNDPRLKLFTGK